jgi:hypothetical protein
VQEKQSDKAGARAKQQLEQSQNNKGEAGAKAGAAARDQGVVDAE